MLWLQSQESPVVVDRATCRGPYWLFRQFLSGGRETPGRRLVAAAVDQCSQP